MKKMSFYFLSMLCLSICSNAVIIETNDIRHLLTHASDNSLYVFDLDNTLIEPHQHLGSDQWVSHMVNKLVEQGLNIEEAFSQVIPCWKTIHEKTKMKLVDNSSARVLKKLKKKQISHIGLTKREPSIADTTLEQLADLEIQFRPASVLENEYVFDHLKGTLYKKGVIFVAAGVDKGPSLLAYLNKLEKMPARIVAIDDKLDHLINMEEIIQPLGIPFIGIRYGATDDSVKAFNPQIADLQLEYFNKILSNEEALHLLQIKQPHITAR